MQEFAGNVEHFNPSQPYAGDEKNPVQFYMGVLQNDGKTAEAGRPIFDDVECIRIFNSKDNIIERPVRDTDKQRFPRQYAAWKQTGESTPGAAGTRLDAWPQITRGQAEEFRYLKVFTVEQLADMPDSQSVNIMGFQKLKSLAKAYVETAKGNAPLVKMQEELDAEKAKSAGLEDMIRKMGAELKELQETVANNSKRK